MCKILGIVFAVLMSLSSMAYSAEGKYAWVFDKNSENQNLKGQVDVENGVIDGEKYIAIVVNCLTGRPVNTDCVVVFKKENNKHEIIAEIQMYDLGGQGGYSVNIRNDSVFIRSDESHHGIYFQQYQFKKINDVFYLVGVELQSMSLSAYATSPEEQSDPNYKEVDMWAGTSINFLTSKMECWQQNFNIEDYEKPPGSPEQKALDVAHSRFDRGLHATAGVKRQVSFPKRKLIRMDKFSFVDDRPDLPPMCYFDHKYRFHRK